MSDDLMRAIRRAVYYHLLGYRKPSMFNANEMLRRMDDLAHALDRFDACAAKNGSQKLVTLRVAAKTAKRE